VKNKKLTLWQWLVGKWMLDPRDVVALAAERDFWKNHSRLILAISAEQHCQEVKHRFSLDRQITELKRITAEQATLIKQLQVDNYKLTEFKNKYGETFGMHVR
jgi:hypothetical protein